MEREDMHVILTQNNLESRKSKCKKDIVFPVTKTVMKARERYKKMVVKNNQVTEEIFELWTKNSID